MENASGFSGREQGKGLGVVEGQELHAQRRLSGMAFMNQGLGPADHRERLESEKIEFH